MCTKANLILQGNTIEGCLLANQMYQVNRSDPIKDKSKTKVACLLK
jgi:hypothetical protein